jgi:hypothetical protein
VTILASIVIELTRSKDATREVAIKGLLSIVDCLQIEELLPVALAVSFNLCNDYGTMQSK